MLLPHFFSELVRPNKLPRTKRELWGKRKLERKLKELNRHLNYVNILLEKRNIKNKHKDRLKRK